MRLKRMLNSIDTLAPDDAFVKAMNKLSLAKGIPCHSIIGDRGRGELREAAMALCHTGVHTSKMPLRKRLSRRAMGLTKARKRLLRS